MSDEEFQRPIVQLSGSVDYDPQDDLWRFVVAVPEELAAALISGSTVRSLLDTQSQDPVIIRNLINQHFDRVEKWVASAEMNKWPEEMGVYLDWKPGKEPK